MSTVSGSVTMLHTSGGVTRAVGAAADTETCWIESKDLDLGDPMAIKFLDEVRVEIDRITSLTNVSMTLKFRDELDEDLTLADVLELINAPGPFPVHPQDAAYFRVRIDDTALSVLWKLSRIEFYGGPAGRKS